MGNYSSDLPDFIGPREINFDLAILKTFKISESKILRFRLEAFNAFGQVVNAAPPCTREHRLGDHRTGGPEEAVFLENVFEEDHSSLAWARGAVGHLYADGGVYGIGLQR
jgi:hypothetical protein